MCAVSLADLGEYNTFSTQKRQVNPLSYQETAEFPFFL